MRILLIFICCLLSYKAFSQEKEWLFAFYNADSTLVGYKNQKNQVVIPANLNASFGLPDKFHNIISVIEDVDGQGIKQYFLTKNGIKVGSDSLHFFDNTPDCENEGFIRFHDRKTDKVGLLNADGKIQIPAEYSAMDIVKNGLITVLKGAQRKRDGEHSFWVGGKSSLIDTNNYVIIEDFPFTADLDFYNILVDDSIQDESYWEKFNGVDGKIYSFINFEKEFKQHLENQFSKEVRDELLNEMCFDTVTYWDEHTGWLKQNSLDFVADHLEKIKPIVISVLDGSADYFISTSHLNPFVFNGPAFQKFFNHCADPMYWKYPVMDLVVNHNVNGNRSQSHLEFLRTEEGYKLILMSLKI